MAESKAFRIVGNFCKTELTFLIYYNVLCASCVFQGKALRPDETIGVNVICADNLKFEALCRQEVLRFPQALSTLEETLFAGGYPRIFDR